MPHLHEDKIIAVQLQTINISPFLLNKFLL